VSGEARVSEIHLVVIGYGYSAAATVAGLPREFRVTATVRSREKADALKARGIDGVVYRGLAPCSGLAERLATATHLLVSAPPNPDGTDPFLAHHGGDLAAAPRLAWIGYYSTVGVYGDHGGAWVDEGTPTAPRNARAKARVAVEEAYLAIGSMRRTVVHLIRLGGIYGPGRNTLVGLAEGWQKRIVKPGQFFSRVHVEDIGGLTRAAMRAPQAGPVLNGVDDEPAAPQDLVVEAARLMGRAAPPEEAFETAALSPMAREFYADNKRVSNARTKRETGYAFVYPTYREGLAALAAARDWERPPPEDA
jgi:dTDP-4-dehydrorhamnose reductase